MASVSHSLPSSCCLLSLNIVRVRSREGVQTAEIELAEKILDCEGIFHLRRLETRLSMPIKRGSEILYHMKCVTWHLGLLMESSRKVMGNSGNHGAFGPLAICDLVPPQNLSGRASKIMKKYPHIEISVRDSFDQLSCI